jgi:uncharacterized membrane protein YfcA
VGMAAGTVNTIVGSGSLITFPTLLALGYSPVVANVSNTLGLVPGSASGAFGYRRELTGQGARLRTLSIAAGAGGLTGGILLLQLPGTVFRDVVPVLILVACLLVIIQPRVSRHLATLGPRSERGGPVLFAAVFLTGIYGGYFGAAQGVLLMALLAIFLNDDLQRLNGAKNVLALIVNGVAALLFLIFAHIAWGAVATLAVGSTIGGQIGARVGRRLPPQLLRLAIVVVGIGVSIKLFAG